MNSEDMEVEGIKPGAVDNIKHDVNPSKQSHLMELGKNILITRPLSEKFTGIKKEDELKRRVEAVKLHEKEVPAHTLHKGHVILQGYKNENGDKKPIPVLGRFLENVKDTKSITELTTKEILSNSMLCKAISDISKFQLKELLEKSIYVDSGNIGSFGKEYPNVLSRFMKHLTSDNVFIGHDAEGNEKVFCDPDWYVDVPNSRDGIKLKLFHSARLLARSLYFYCAYKYGQLREKLSPNKAVGLELQRERKLKKSAT